MNPDRKSQPRTKPYNKILVLAIDNESQLEHKDWDLLLQGLPAKLHSSVNRPYKWQDRQASLFGKLLLKKGLELLKKNGFALLETLTWDAYKKPFLPAEAVHFNISHSSKIVVCAVSESGRVGIDIEEIREITVSDYERFFTNNELTWINDAAKPSNAFFVIWTKKEALIKAEGKGFYNDLKSIDVCNDRVYIDNRGWTLQRVSLSKNYMCHLASEQERIIEIHRYVIRDLIGH